MWYPPSLPPPAVQVSTIVVIVIVALFVLFMGSLAVPWLYRKRSQLIECCNNDDLQENSNRGRGNNNHQGNSSQRLNSNRLNTVAPAVMDTPLPEAELHAGNAPPGYAEATGYPIADHRKDNSSQKHRQEGEGEGEDDAPPPYVFQREEDTQCQ